MTDNIYKIVKCPTCGKPVPWLAAQTFKPFCSKRCKLIDLGEWIMEEKVIPGESVTAFIETNAEAEPH
ncbi:MAG: DNA gyrase inhibitor YacG [Gammaproteobacteria bacterium]